MKPFIGTFILWFCAFTAYPAPFPAGNDTMPVIPIHLAEILPQPGAKLNYTQIMFDHPQLTGANEYLVEISLASDGLSFKNLWLKQKDSSTATIISNFQFGQKYVWRYTGLHSGKELGWKGPYNFEILNSSMVDKKLFRVRVLQNDLPPNTGGLVMLDMFRCVDRAGNFVWFLPGGATAHDTGASAIKSAPPVEDLRISPFGTVTFLNGEMAEETDLNGNILWKAPPKIIRNPDSAKAGSPYSYHHSFVRLASGKYMVLDMRTVIKRVVFERSPATPSGESKVIDGAKYKVAYEIIKEFDPGGNLVWSWSSENYFKPRELGDIIRNKPDHSLRNQLAGGHMNAFDVDEKNGFVYAGFRNANKVIKIDKKSQQVICAWGDSATYNNAPNGQGFFSKQHDTKLLHDGSIAVFNNGPAQGQEDSAGSASSVVIFTQPTDSANSRIIWKYDFNFDSENNVSKTGGSIDELKNGNLLIDMGDVNRVFEITRSKHIVWSALIEKYAKHDSTWQPMSLYRAHYTSSLYPCYFTIQTSRDTLSKSQPSFQLKVFNDGTEDDSYQVNISSSSGKYKKQFATPVLSGKKSTTINILPNKLPTASDAIILTVKSNTNPGFIRTINILYKK